MNDVMNDPAPGIRSPPDIQRDPLSMGSHLTTNQRNQERRNYNQMKFEEDASLDREVSVYAHDRVQSI